jgi:ketosteroid isomerase-like protein
MPPLPKRGFDNNGQDPARYTPEEKAAAAIVEKWIETINHDTDGHMALIDDNILVRADPTSRLTRGPAAYCSTFLPGLGSHTGNYPLTELYVVGGKGETDVLVGRTDFNAPPGGQGFLGGYGVPVASFLRIRNGRIIEWEDMPTNKISAGGLPFRIQLDGPRRTPAWCVKYTDGSNSARQPGAVPAHSLNYWYGTEKAEYFFNPFEESAAQTVRAWFAAWQSGDPLLLGAFTDVDVVFRARPSDELGHGRDNLLRQVCGITGGKRKLIDLFVIGGDYDSSVLTRWDETNAQGNITHMASFFRAQNGLITEWMYDTPLDSTLSSGSPGSSERNSPACQAVNAALGPASATPAAAAQ